MSPELEQYLPYIVIGFVVAVLVLWLIARANRKTSVIGDENSGKDVLDDGAAPASRNQALIDAPTSAENTIGQSSANANSETLAAASVGADAEAGASVTPTRPLHLAHCAVNRVTASGRLLGEDERISPLAAMRAQTIDAAWQVFQEDVRGSIEPGKLAVLAILSRNLLEQPERIAETRVLRTIRRGKAVFESDEWRTGASTKPAALKANQ